MALTPDGLLGITAAMIIYKILRADEWNALNAQGETDGAPIDQADGYIHFSTADQAMETAAKYFADVEGLWLLALDSEQLGRGMKWEPSRGGQLFPHLYGKLRLADIIWARPLPQGSNGHDFPETVAGHVDPTRTQFDTFKSLDRDHPIEMLNLVRLRTDAQYPPSHVLAQDKLSGRQAYANFGRDTAAILERLGGLIVWRGQVQAMVIGPDNERWDIAFVARYPSAHAFLEMVTDPAYKRAVVHRQAAVRTSRLIRCEPADAGASFG